MIILNLKGGLANQLFIYASGSSFAEKRNTSFKLHVHELDYLKRKKESGLKNFNVNFSPASQQEISDILPTSLTSRLINRLKARENRNYFRLNDLDFSKAITKSTQKNQYLDGYFANEYYFKQSRTRILSEITLKDHHITDDYLKTIDWIKKNQFTSVHVRRKDYLTKPASDFFQNLTVDYYNRCMSYIEKKDPNTKYLFFSDDIEWVKENFSNPNKFFFINTPSLNHDFYDLKIMSQCKNHIIANSTFSWWSAWLNENDSKTVLAPRKWYKDQKMQALADQTYFIPKDWIKI